MENKDENKTEEVNPNESKKETLTKIEWNKKALVIFVVALILIITIVIIIISLTKKTSNGGDSCNDGGKTCPLHIVILYLNTLGFML
jgi:hypothetical protein